MPLRDQFDDDLKAAMKQKDVLRLSVLRMVKTAVKNQEIAVGHPLSDDEVMKVLNTLVKQRRDSVEQFQKGGRPELADKEAREIVLIEHYLPQGASPEEIEAAIAGAIQETNAASAKDIGLVMKAVMKRLEGRPVDGRLVNQKVRERLA